MRIYLCECANAENYKRVETYIKLTKDLKLINPRNLSVVPLEKEERRRLKHLLIDCCDEVWLLREWEAEPEAMAEKTYAETFAKKPIKTQTKNWKKFV